MSLIPKVADYIERRGGKFFKDWSRESIEAYVMFHVEQSTISIVLNDDDDVKGLIVGWQQKGADHIPWAWQKTDKDGDHWWWDQYIADTREAAAMAAVALCERFPQAARLPCLGFRRGKIRKYLPGDILNIFTTAEKLYGN